VRSRLQPQRRGRRHERCQKFAAIRRLYYKRGGRSENCHGVDTSWWCGVVPCQASDHAAEREDDLLTLTWVSWSDTLCIRRDFLQPILKLSGHRQGFFI
jgi:hypothetical protein